MRNIAIIDENFGSNVASANHLSIQYGERQCSFAVLDTEALRYMAFKNIWFDTATGRDNQADHIRSILQAESYLIRQFRSVHFMYLSPWSVLVPAALFQKDHPETYFKYSADIHPSDKILFRKIQSVDSFTVFPVPADFLNQVEIMLPDVHIFHQSSPHLQEAILESGHTSDHTRVSAYVSPGFADIVVIRDDRPLLYNSYVIRNTNELVFFILYLFEQFSLSQETSPVILSGFPEWYDGLIELLSPYVKKIVYREFPGNFTYSPVFAGLPQHQFSTFLNLARCE